MNQQDTKLSAHDNIWHFSVTDPVLHKKKFTVYKVTCKTFPIKSPEVLTEIVCWKRYSDFKDLCKSLFALHKALHRRNPFPEFAKPKLFGRFDDTVIEERRQSALDLLNFVAGQPHLYKSLIFRQFLDDGKSKASRSQKQSPFVLGPSSTLDVLSGETSQSDGKPPPDLVPIIAHNTTTTTTAPTPKPDLSSDNGVENEDGKNSQTGEKRNSADYKLSQVIGLEGTWNYPQVADNISLGSSSGEETVDTDEDSVMTQGLPDPEMAFFDPMAAKGLRSPSESHEPHLATSHSWLLTGLNLCAEMETDVIDETDKGGKENENEQKEHRSNTDFSNSSTLVSESSASTIGEGDGEKNETEPGPLDGLDLDDFDPLRKMSESSVTSRIECGKGDLDLSGHWQTASSGSFSSQASSSSQRAQFSNASSDGKVYLGAKSQSYSSSKSQSFGSVKPSDSEKKSSISGKGLLKKLISKSPSRKPRSTSDQSVSNMDLGGKEDYIYQAASKISMAQNSEANGDFEVAFAYYKSGVGILLQGVQSDSNKSRRDAVRRKTAQYLMKAEDLFNRHLSSENVNERRWGVDSFLSPSLDLDPSLAFIRGSVKELRNFQVLGILDRVVLIRDKVTDETFVIKSIRKSPATESKRCPSILPTSCPFMVSLHKFYETDNAIYLLLQYANGGKLWNYVGDYLSGEHSMHTGIQLNFEAEEEESKNIYSGCKLEGSDNDNDVSPVKEESTDPSSKQASGDGTETCLARILSKEAVKQVEEHKTNVQSSSHTAGAVRFSNLRESSGNVEDEKDDENTCVSASESEECTYTAREKEPLARQVSSFSDDSSHIYDADTSAQSPSSFPDEYHFQNLLQEHRTTVEGFSINSFDSEDRRLSSACFDRIDSIAEDQEPAVDSTSYLDKVASPDRPTVQKQLSEDDVFLSSDTKKFASTFNSHDIVKSSKELLREVDKVLYETDLKKEDSKEGKNSNSSENSTVENPNSVASSEIEEPSIYDLNRYSGEESSDPSISDQKETSPTEKKFPSSNAGPFPIVHKKHAVSEEQLNKASPSEAEFNSRPRLNSTSAIFRQTSTPHKLSITRMNSKEMTRSASFDCDVRSPTRNRVRTINDLFEHLDSQNQEQICIPETSIRKWMANIVTAVSRLHSLGIICRDLKPSNILLAEGGIVYLSYFCHLGHGDQEFDWEAVNDLYAAPEVRSIGGYNMACDWWSIGALLYELVIGRSLRECHPGGINSHTCLHIPSFVSDEARGLLDGLLVFNPKERLGSGIAGSEEIKAHPFFNGVDWHALESS